MTKETYSDALRRLEAIIAWTIPAYFYLQWRQSLTNLDHRSDAGTSTISN